MEGWCQTMERDAEDNELPEEGEPEWGQQGSETKMDKKRFDFVKLLTHAFSCSSRAHSKCGWKRPDTHVSEGPAVFPPLPAKCGEYVAANSKWP